jgi:hypothetical protein
VQLTPLISSVPADCVLHAFRAAADSVMKTTVVATDILLTLRLPVTARKVWVERGSLFRFRFNGRRDKVGRNEDTTFITKG